MAKLKELLMGGPGHDGYAYQADVVCVECGHAIIRDQFDRKGFAKMTTDQLNDSEVCPCPIFFGESDQAEHCSRCGDHLYGPNC